jgi:histidine kinase
MLGKTVAERKESLNFETSEGVVDCLTNEGRILPELVPSLSTLRCDSSDVENAEDSSPSVSFAMERLAVAFQSFLKAFCSPSCPLVLFVDDLQWADGNSMKVLSTLAVDHEI